MKKLSYSMNVHWIVDEDEKFVVGTQGGPQIINNRLNLYLYNIEEQMKFIPKPNNTTIYTKTPLKFLKEYINIIHQYIAENKYKICMTDYNKQNILVTPPDIKKFKIAFIKRNFTLNNISEVSLKRSIQKENRDYLTDKQNKINSIISKLDIKTISDDDLSKIEEMTNSMNNAS